MRDSIRVGVVINPKHARTSRAYSQLVRAFKHGRIRYRSATTTPERPGAAQATNLVTWGADVVLVLGGDGTLRVTAPVLAAAQVPVVVIPTGTANVFTRHIGKGSVQRAITSSAEALNAPIAEWRRLAMHYRIDVPVNEVDWLGADGRWQHGCFLSMTGVGGDARAVAGHGTAPGLLGYIRGGATALLAPNFEVSVTANDSRSVSVPRNVWSVMASKVSHPAGPIPVFPAAKAEREDFELLAVAVGEPGRRLGEWARIGLDYLWRRPAHNPNLHYWTETEATISLDRPEPAHLDGDPIGDCREMRIRAGTQRLTVLHLP